MKPEERAAALSLAVLQQCRSCRATCCTYLTVQIDNPGDDPDEYEAIRWYLTRPNTRIHVDDDGDWFLQIDQRCRFLQADFSCGNYFNRPGVCKDYDPKSCEYWDKPEDKFPQEWRTLEAFDAWYFNVRKPEMEAKAARAKSKRQAQARKAARARWDARDAAQAKRAKQRKPRAA